MDQAERPRQLLPAGSLPVCGETDLLIVGATFGGVALADAAARAGASVTVVEARTYPGAEAMATLRPWLPAEALHEPPPSLEPWLAAATPLPAQHGELALHPDAVKRGLEDVLHAAGVRLLYASRPVGIVRAGDEPAAPLAGVVIGNKSGRQALLARAVVDATPWATVARLAGVPFVAVDDAAVCNASRTLEFTGVADQDLAAQVAVPASVGLAADHVSLHPGYLGSGHILVECPLLLPREDGTLWPDRTALEVEARRRSLAVAAYLVQHHPAFAGASLAQSAWELRCAASARRAGAIASDALLLAMRYGGQEIALPLAAFATPTANLVILGSAAALSPEAQAAMLDPVIAARAGAALAPTVRQAAAALPAPDSDACVARCGPGAGASLAASPLTVREPEAPQRGRRYARVREEAAALPCLADVDVLVVGGGTSGATAAAVAAGSGASTALLEMHAGLGGTGTLGGVDSYWYGRRGGFTAEVDRRYAAQAARLGVTKQHTWNIEAKMHALLTWVDEAGVKLLLDCVAVGALVEPAPTGGRPTVGGVLVATADGLAVVRSRVTIDATGDGDIAAFAGARFVYGSARDRLPLWYSLAQFARPGVSRNNFTSSVDVGNVEDYTRAILAGRRRGEGHDHGVYVAPRESRHIVGGVTHTLTDQLTLRRFPDVVNICCSNSDIKGKSGADWVLWGLLPPNVESEIAYRALVPEDLDGLLVAGKAFSCTHDALPAIRMQADLQNLGGVCALAAGMAVAAGVEPRQVDVPALQRRLVTAGVLPPEVLGREGPLDPVPPSAVEMQTLVDGLTGDEPFYIDMGFEDVQREPLELVRACTAGEAIVPLLAAAYSAASGGRRLLLARLLAWYGSAAGLPCLSGEIERQLAGGTLPERRSKIRHANLPPDQGAMPEVCYLLFTLGMLRDPAAHPAIIALLRRVVALLQPTAADFRDRIKGTFHYVDAVCSVAERLGDPAAAPLLQDLHGRDGLHGLQAQAPEPDYFLERMAYLELAIGRALARCGSPDGARVLCSYLDDARAILAEHAHDELIAVAGADFGKDQATWLAWIARQGDQLACRPWLARVD
ncbi:MAG TPA: FAD-dependent oxidoreductase [Chloroflexota bacterium]|nr:FAD-dependent oxidoreductase [Chloroflexota bacterium]